MEQLNNIKVAIVEVSSTNDITPNNTVDEILACEETRLVSLDEYEKNDDRGSLPEFSDYIEQLLHILQSKASNERHD